MSEKAKDKDKAKTLGELAGVAGGSSFEGDKCTMEEIENEVVKVIDFRFSKSKFQEGDFLTLQIERTVKGKAKKDEKKPYVVLTNAQVIMKGFKNLSKDNLPADTKFFRTEGKNKRSYWTME